VARVRGRLNGSNVQGDWYRWFGGERPSMISRCLDIVLRMYAWVRELVLVSAMTARSEATRAARADG